MEKKFLFLAVFAALVPQVACTAPITLDRILAGSAAPEESLEYAIYEAYCNACNNVTYEHEALQMVRDIYGEEEDKENMSLSRPQSTATRQPRSHADRMAEHNRVTGQSSNTSLIAVQQWYAELRARTQQFQSPHAPVASSSSASSGSSSSAATSSSESDSEDACAICDEKENLRTLPCKCASSRMCEDCVNLGFFTCHKSARQETTGQEKFDLSINIGRKIQESEHVFCTHAYHAQFITEQAPVLCDECTTLIAQEIAADEHERAGNDNGCQCQNCKPAEVSCPMCKQKFNRTELNNAQ